VIAAVLFFVGPLRDMREPGGRKGEVCGVCGGPGYRLDARGGGLCDGLLGRTGRMAPAVPQMRGLGLTKNYNDPR
jgi:hypothetical protein